MCRVASARIAAGALVEGLAHAGVELAIGLDDPRGYFAALRRSNLRTVLVHDERSGGFMADGYARASGIPAGVSGNSGPGPRTSCPG